MWAFAVAKPLLDTMSASTLLEWHYRPSDVVLVAVGLIVLPPALLLALELAAGRIDPRLRDWLHIAIVAVLVYFLVAYTVRKQIDPTARSLIFASAVLLALAAALAYARFGGVRLFVTVLVVAPVVFVGQYLLGSSANDVAFPAEPAAARAAAAATPVVMVVFDEFPVTSLMTGDGRLAKARFPSFAALARTSTWYRNAVTVHDNTAWAVPAIASGIRSPKKSYPDTADHPRTLFELLGRSHTLQAFEASERLCPATLCHESSQGSFPGRIAPLLGQSSLLYLGLTLPKRVSTKLPDPKPVPDPRPDRDVRRFVAALGRRTVKPRFAYLHVLAPHTPYRYLPSRRRYLDPGILDAVGTGPTPTNRVLADTYLERHLAQVAFTDRLVSDVMAALRRSGELDRSLVVVTADHGISFLPGAPGSARRAANPLNSPEILGVPLFVKAPGQRRGRVDSSYARTIDIAPTVAGTLHARAPWRMDGRPLGGGGPLPPRLTVDAWLGSSVTIPTTAFERGRAAQVARIDRAYAPGAAAASLQGYGPRPDLVGRPLASLRVRGAPSTKARIDRAGAFQSTNLGGDVPGFVSGELSGAGARLATRLAVALNGHVAATAWTYRDRRGHVRFAAFTGDRWLRAGRNEVTVLAMPPTKTAPLVRLGQ